MINITDFKKVELRVGTIVEVSDFKEAHDAAFQLKIDFGGFGMRQSSAKITDYYTKEVLLNRQIIAVVNFPIKNIASFNSEVLVLGVDGKEKGIVLLDLDKPMQNGAKIS